MPADLLQQMHDITELDPISNWPLAVGWWLIITLLFGVVIGGLVFYKRRKAYRNSWLYLIYTNLVTLEKEVDLHSKKYIITELSENLRQLAVKKYSRQECASIAGGPWLEWLEQRDKKKFAWTKHGRVLADGPYAPNLAAISNAEIILLIKAAKRWAK